MFRNAALDPRSVIARIILSYAASRRSAFRENPEMLDRRSKQERTPSQNSVLSFPRSELREKDEESCNDHGILAVIARQSVQDICSCD